MAVLTPWFDWNLVNIPLYETEYVKQNAVDGAMTLRGIGNNGSKSVNG
jgi:hypothetical protein